MSSRVLKGDEYLALPRSPQTWLVENLLPVSGSMLLFGDPKVGKSYAGLQLCFDLAAGPNWLGFPIPRAARPMYVQLDTPRSLWGERLDKLREEGFPVDAVHFADRETLDTYPFDILLPSHFDLLRSECAELKPDVVVLDTIREAHSGDENDSTEMQEVIARLDAAVKPAALVLISHARKSNPEAGYDLMNDNRGSNYIVGRMDAICRFSKSSMRCTSRTMEEHSVKLDRQDDGTWIPSEDPFKSLAEITIQNNPNASLRELARKLHESYPLKSEDACRSALRRLKK